MPASTIKQEAILILPTNLFVLTTDTVKLATLHLASTLAFVRPATRARIAKQVRARFSPTELHRLTVLFLSYV